MNLAINIIFWILIISGVYLYIRKSEGNNKIIKLLFFMILARLFFTNLKYLLGLPPKFPDAEFYSNYINDIIKSGMDFSVVKERLDVQVYVWFYSIIQLISGNVYITIISLNSIFGSLAIYNAGRIAGEIKDNKAKAITMVLLFIYPTFLLYTSDNLREGMVLYFITLAMYKIVKYIKYNDNRELICYIMILFPIFVLRVVNLLIMIIFGILSFIIVNRKKINIKLLTIMTILVTILGVIFIYQFTNIRISLDYINQMLNRDRFDSMTYLAGLRYDSWIELIIYTPIRLFYFMFHPFPWIIDSYRYLTVTISSLYEFIVFLCIITLMIVQVRNYKIKNRKELYIFIGYIFIGLTIYAVVKTEAAARHRLQFMWGLPTVLGVLISNQISIYKNNILNKDI